MSIYPCIIVFDRYHGTYSGGMWTAFNTSEIPEGATLDDMMCADFWTDEMRANIGLGQTPDEAHADLVRKLATKAADRKEDSVSNRKQVLRAISEDMAQDAKRFDGQLLSGRTVAEYLGNLGAAVAALADILHDMNEEQDTTKE